MEQLICYDNKILLSFLFQRRRYDWRATLHEVNTGLRGPLLFHLSLRVAKSEPIGLLEYSQMEKSIDKICTEEFEAGGIYSSRKIKPYAPIWILQWMHAVLTRNRLTTFSFSISVKNLFSYFEHIWPNHCQTQDIWRWTYFLAHDDCNTTRAQSPLFLIPLSMSYNRG